MREQKPDAAPAGAPIELTFDGRPLAAREGQTIAAALLASGRAGWRTTRKLNRPRGVFCGIGVCFDCLATVNGVRSVRTCLVVAQPGDAVESELATGHDELAV